MRFNELWEEPGLESYVLYPLSLLYALGWTAYESLYKFGFKRSKAPHHPVICVGNLVAGGSGKTPFVIYLAQTLQRLGKEVVISASGYGGPASKGATLAPSETLKVKDWGDEPAMLRDALPDVPLIVGRDRVKAAELCALHHPSAVLLLDDGFQHLPLKKHLSILLDPVIGNRFTIPAGPYREPRRSGLKKAHLVFPDSSEAFQVIQQPSTFSTPEGDSVPLEEVTRGPVDLLCGLGRPYRLLMSLESQGLKIQEPRFLPDHDPLTGGTLLKGLGESRPLVVTAKDWVKLREHPDVKDKQILVTSYQVRVEPQADFERWVQTKLDGTSKKAI